MKRILQRLGVVLVVLLTSSSILMGPMVQPAAAFLDPGDIKTGAKRAAPVVKGLWKGSKVTNPLGWVLIGVGVMGFAPEDYLFDFLFPEENPKGSDVWAPGNPEFDEYYNPTGLGKSSDPRDWGPIGWSSGHIRLAHRTEINGLSASGRGLSITVTAIDSNNVALGTKPNTPFGQIGTVTNNSVLDYQCRSASGVDQSMLTGGFSFSINANVTGGVQTSNTPDMCLVGETLIGFRLSPMSSPSGYFQRDYGIGWGTLAGVDWNPTINMNDPVVFEQARVTVKCENMVTGAIQSIVSTQDYGLAETVAVPSCKKHLGDDWAGVQIKVQPITPKIGGKRVNLPDVDPYIWTPERTPVDHPDFDPCETSTKGCEIVIYKDNQICKVGGTCTDLDVIEKHQPERLKCKMGKTQVHLSFCTTLIKVLVSTTPTTTTRPDRTKPDDDEDQPIPRDPDTPKTTPDVKVVPDLPPDEKNEAEECFPSGWGIFNPFSWVYKPIKCALKWAFIPSPDTWGLGLLKLEFESRPPGSLIIGIKNGLLGAVDAFSSSSCGVIATFQTPVGNRSINCSHVTGIPGYSALYSLMQLALYGMVGLHVFNVITAQFKRGET